MNGQDRQDPCSHEAYLVGRGDKPAHESVSGSGKCCEGNKTGWHDESMLALDGRVTAVSPALGLG